MRQQRPLQLHSDSSEHVAVLSGVSWFVADEFTTMKKAIVAPYIADARVGCSGAARRYPGNSQHKAEIQLQEHKRVQERSHYWLILNYLRSFYGLED